MLQNNIDSLDNLVFYVQNLALEVFCYKYFYHDILMTISTTSPSLVFGVLGFRMKNHKKPHYSGMRSILLKKSDF